MASDTTPPRDEVLDNAVWHSIDGPRAGLADRRPRAGRFLRDVAAFAGLADNDPASWDDLATMVGPGKATALFNRYVEPPPGWRVEEALSLPCVQMVAGPSTPARSAEGLVELGPDDVPEMIDLVNATQPGPFFSRTIEFGGYLGVRQDRRLVAMGGERLRCPGYTEISAVCTASDQRGKGLGSTIVLALVERIRARGEEAFLHTRDTNTTAIRLYEQLGFTLRCEFPALVVRREA